MPKIEFQGKQIEIGTSDISLRKALINEGYSPHNGNSAWLNCKGLGTCGTCAIHFEGTANEPTPQEKWRLNFPPFKDGLSQGLRLACQLKISGDCKIRKGQGFWGEDFK